MSREPESDRNMVPFPRLSDGEMRDLEALIREADTGGEAGEDLRRRVLGLEEDLGRVARLVLRLDEEVRILTRLERISRQRNRCLGRLLREQAGKHHGGGDGGKR